MPYDPSLPKVQHTFMQVHTQHKEEAEEEHAAARTVSFEWPMRKKYGELRVSPFMHMERLEGTSPEDKDTMSYKGHRMPPKCFLFLQAFCLN